MRFFDIDQPIYNLSMDGLTNDDTDPLHWDLLLQLPHQCHR